MKSENQTQIYLAILERLFLSGHSVPSLAILTTSNLFTACVNDVDRVCKHVKYSNTNSVIIMYIYSFSDSYSTALNIPNLLKFGALSGPFDRRFLKFLK